MEIEVASATTVRGAAGEFAIFHIYNLHISMTLLCCIITSYKL